MKRQRSVVLYSIVLTLTLAAGAVAQGTKFIDINVDYSFDLPNEKWRMTVKPSATSPNVEYVCGDRLKGHLEVRRLTVGKDAVLSDLMRDEEQKQLFLFGFVARKKETFNGRLRGEIFNFDYVAAGRNMSGRFYFLRANPTTVYVLRFRGQEDSLISLLAQTDSIARSFTVKQ